MPFSTLSYSCVVPRESWYGLAPTEQRVPDRKLAQILKVLALHNVTCHALYIVCSFLLAITGNLFFLPVATFRQQYWSLEEAAQGGHAVSILG